jgi:hypothetical protein
MVVERLALLQKSGCSGAVRTEEGVEEGVEEGRNQVPCLAPLVQQL